MLLYKSTLQNFVLLPVLQIEKVGAELSCSGGKLVPVKEINTLFPRRLLPFRRPRNV